MRVIFTDLDGTLLDAETYSFQPARSALLECRAKGVPVIFCTSKTRAETEYLRLAIGNDDPFIVENGGAAYVPERYFRGEVPSGDRVGKYLRIRLGKDYGTILQVMERFKTEAGGSVRGFHEMTAEEVATRCGLSVEQARMAREREFDEPFAIERDTAGLLPRLAALAAEEGMQMTVGGRFFHLHGGSDKGMAVTRLLDLYRAAFDTIESIGIGDAANDLPMLRAVDRPFAVARPDGSCDPTLRAGVPRLEFVQEPGPRGWGVVVHRVLGTA